MSDAYPVRSSVPEIVEHLISLVGTGAAIPTKVTGTGPGITVTRTSAGLYVLTWSENPGIFIGLSWGLGADTPLDVDRFSLVRSAFASNALSITVFSEAGTATDLAALQYVDIVIRFKRTAV